MLCYVRRITEDENSVMSFVIKVTLVTKGPQRVGP